MCIRDSPKSTLARHACEARRALPGPARSRASSWARSSEFSARRWEMGARSPKGRRRASADRDVELCGGSETRGSPPIGADRRSSSDVRCTRKFRLEEAGGHEGTERTRRHRGKTLRGEAIKGGFSERGSCLRPISPRARAQRHTEATLDVRIPVPDIRHTTLLRVSTTFLRSYQALSLIHI